MPKSNDSVSPVVVSSQQYQQPQPQHQHQSSYGVVSNLADEMLEAENVVGQSIRNVAKSRKSSVSSSYSSASSSTLSELRSCSSPLLHEFYRNRSVFITGGTGFVGKVLIEKLLYEFRDIGQIYVLLRPKAGQLIRKRMQELIGSPAFNRIRQHCPEQFEKIIPISGDIAYSGLGINPLELAMITANVTIIFHSAATIRFDEPLKYALKLNTMGTKRVIELGKKLKNLSAFVHVSTAYCTANKFDIEEKVYREPISPDKVLEMADWMDDETFNEKMKEIFYQGRPCSYHYTKSLAEHLIVQEVERGYTPNYTVNGSDPNGSDHDGLDSIDSNEQIVRPVPCLPTSIRSFPAAIIRPSIITAAWKEPFPGWIDNYNGTTGFMVVNGKGVLRTMHANSDYVTDIIPVDIVINSCISAAWYVAECQCKLAPMSINNRRSSECSSSGLSSAGTSMDRIDGNDVFVVNCVSGSLNPITWAQLRDMTTPILMKYPSSELFRVPGVRYHRYQILHQLNLYLEHTVPAAVVDFIFRFLGHTPVLHQVYQKVHRTINALEHFTMNEWTYRCDNLLLLDRNVSQSYARKRYMLKESSTMAKSIETDKLDQPAFSYYQVNSKSSTFSDDQHPFPMDIGQLDWEQYFENYVLGIRKYLLKENPDTIPEARKTLLMLKMVTSIGKLAIGSTIAYQLLNPRSMTRQFPELLRTYLMMNAKINNRS
ncbi:hypothetical protein BLOT_008816 [Blomia tropicalis]|nr:hypothetical protein BLOT_008816 [Blomia tropicalis]